MLQQQKQSLGVYDVIHLLHYRHDKMTSKRDHVTDDMIVSRDVTKTDHVIL